MNNLIRLCVVVFFGALGVAVGYRLSSEAMAVVVGVVVGVLATLPVALLVLYAMRRPERPVVERAPEPTTLAPQPPAPVQPQILVVPAPMPTPPPMPRGWYGAPTQMPVERQFQIYGEDD